MSERLTNIETDTEIKERCLVEYNEKEKKIMELDKTSIIAQIEKNKLIGISKIYDNQDKCSLTIVEYLKTDKKIISILVVALTQSGKTGTMCGIIENYLKEPNNLIPLEHIYIITGLSSCEWKEQTQARMPKEIQDRVYHRDYLATKFVDDIKDKKNVLIIIDEIQIAAKEKQSLYTTFKKVGFYDKKKLLRNDIKIIEFSATPDGTILDQGNWGENGEIIIMNPGEGYTSCFNLTEQNRVFQYKNLCEYNKKTGEINEELVAKNILELKSKIDEYKEALYHIIRTPGGKEGEIVIDNFKNHIDINLKYYHYNQESDIEDINNILNKEPNEDTYIFIKEKLRCAKTLKKNYLGVVYERYAKKPDDAVIIQGLIGRGTGYDDNGKSIYFTNIDSINRYKDLWESEFEDKKIKWKSKTTKMKNYSLQSTGTYMNADLIDGMNVSSEESNEEREPFIYKCKTQEEAKEYYNKELKEKMKGRGPNKIKPNDDGYYEANIRGNKKVYSYEEVFKNRRCNIENGAGYGLRPCYEDVNDKSTLQFWMIHY